LRFAGDDRPSGDARILPRGLNRRQSAFYLGIGTTKFDEMVKDGRMPKPRVIDTRTVWDRYELDDAFEALPHREEENPWDAV